MSKNHAPAVFIILDAFRWDYLTEEDAPFLHQMAQQGIWGEKLISSSGFTQRSAIFSGAPADVHGAYTMFCYGPDNSPWSFLKPFSAILKLVETKQWKGNPVVELFNHQLRHRVIDRLAQSRAAFASCAQIPLFLLPMIGISEDTSPIYSAGAISVQSIFDVMRSCGKTFKYLMFPDIFLNDDGVLDAAVAAARQQHDLYLLQFTDSDSGVHTHSPTSVERHQIVKELDRKIRVLFEAYEKQHPGVQFLVIGDHGMTDVHTNVDVATVVHGYASRSHLLHGVDYLLFLDSTLARLWYLTDKARRDLSGVWSLDPLGTTGKLMTPEDAAKHRVPPPGERYGHAIWVAEPGVLIRPDYFHKIAESVKGMHGYDSNSVDMKGCAVLFSGSSRPTRLPQVTLFDICATLSDLVSIPYPERNEGHSLFKQASKSTTFKEYART